MVIHPWDVIDVGFAAWSWTDFVNNPSLANLGWATLDTFALLPILPSTGYFRRGTSVGNKTIRYSNRFNRIKNSVRATFEGGRITRTVLKKPMKVYRYHGGKTGRIGSYFTTEKFSSRLAARNKLALKQEWGNKLTKISEFIIPEGTVIYRGKTVEQLQKNGKLLKGGADQIYIPKVAADWRQQTFHFKK